MDEYGIKSRVVGVEISNARTTYAIVDIRGNILAEETFDTSEYPNVDQFVSVLSEKNGRVIPWYVLTGGDETEVSDSINDERMQWDRDWTESTNKKFYSWS